MRANRFHHLADRPLLLTLDRANANERASVAEVIELIAEVDERRLYLPEGYPSMSAYCVGRLGYSEHVALKRIQAARAVQEFPSIVPALADGRFHLSGVCLLAPHLHPGTANDLLYSAEGKTNSQIESLIAARFPKTEMLPLVERVPSARPMDERAGCEQHVAEHDADPVQPSNESLAGSNGEHDARHVRPSNAETKPAGVEPAPRLAPRTRMTPTSTESYALHVTISKGTHDLLRDVQALVSHSIPTGDVAQVLHLALEALKTKLEKRKYAATEKPRPRTGKASSNPRHVPADVKRAVRRRDGEQCTFASDSGHRCEERRFLELDHIVPTARGGPSTVENLRLRCRAHNQFEAERTFGKEFMDEKREQARRSLSATRVRRELSRSNTEPGNARLEAPAGVA